MADTEQWPPRSPLKALLSSPSGRKRYREYHTSNVTSTSPLKLLGSPSLLERMRAARADRDPEFLEPQRQEGEHNHQDEEEDEETLQLKLQAIEARLKLKKLQQQKIKCTESIRPQSSTSTTSQATKISSRLEIAVSPTKRTPAFTPKSPSRVVLGIDKGVSAADISLKRARTVNGKSTKDRDSNIERRLSRPFSAQSTPRSGDGTNASIKSFSERMAEMRSKDKSQEEKRTATQHARSSHFKLDKNEMDGYHATSSQPSAIRATSPICKQKILQGSSNVGEESKPTVQPQGLKHSRSLPAMRGASPPEGNGPNVSASGNTGPVTEDEPKGDPTLYEPFSGTHLSTRILPHTFMKRTLPKDQFEIFTLPRLLKTVISPVYQMPDEITDYVVFGTIASKSSPRDHKARASETNSTSSKDWEKKWDDGTMNRQKFIIMTLTDLKWTVDLFLFDTAVPRYHRLTPGTVIAILNPSIMPPKKGREDTGAFSLALHNGEDQILEIGKSKYLSHCKSKRKDGNPCGSWVDGSKTEICEWHLNAELDRARSKRMGVNSMGGFSGERKKEKNFRRGFDSEAQSFYYAVGGTAPVKQKNEQWSFAPTYNSNLSTAKLLDSTNPDDLFVASGQMLERDKQGRLNKQMAAQEKEREIARKLGDLGHKGGAGGEYFRQRIADPNAAKTSKGMNGPAVTKEDILCAKPGESKKRAAESVRLSPVKKKTRFLTSAGIKEAGRDSLGPGSKPVALQARKHDFDDMDDGDDDDLDIV